MRLGKLKVGKSLVGSNQLDEMLNELKFQTISIDQPFDQTLLVFTGTSRLFDDIAENCPTPYYTVHYAVTLAGMRLLEIRRENVRS